MTYRTQKFTIALILFILLIIPVTIVLWGFLQRTGEPLTQLQKGFHQLKVRQDSSYTVELGGNLRRYHDITLAAKTGERVSITLSLPDTEVQQYPVLVVLGGLEIGRESLRYIKRPGKNAIVSYEYPYSPEYWYENAGVREIPAVRDAMLQVPAQITGILHWIQNQQWAEQNKISLLGYSFGALFLPASYHLAQSQSITFGPSVIAYGGANLYQLLRSNMQSIEAPLNSVIAWIAASAIYPLEPAHHLPELQGEFLVINGKQDEKIPETCWNLLQELTPALKTIMNIEASHMHPKKPQLTNRLVELSRQWLLERQAINP